MSMMIGKSNSNVVRIELKNADGTSAGSIGFTKPSPKKKKRLQYNFKAISAQIMQAKTSGGASQVAAKARRQIAVLQRNMKSDEYNEDEIKNAIAHAKSLERVARKRMKHLRQEEALKQDGNPYLSEMEEKVEDLAVKGMDPEELLKLSEEELKQLMDELQEAMQELESEVSGTQATDKLDSLEEVVEENIDVLDLERLKRKHRSDELREIMEADMKYLKALFNKLAKEKQNAASGSIGSSDGSGSADNLSGVMLQLSGVDMTVPTAEIPAPVSGGNMDISI